MARASIDGISTSTGTLGVPSTGAGPKTMYYQCECHANALALNGSSTQVVIAGRNVFRVFSVEDDSFVERVNMRTSKHNYCHFDIAWSGHDEATLASAATNGHVVIWNLSRGHRERQDVTFEDHKRTVNRVTFHHIEAHWLLSGSQDATMKLFDLRNKVAPLTFVGSERIRDVQFAPAQTFLFGAATDNGNIQLWDIRRPDHRLATFTAHSGPVFAFDWHPEIDNLVATAGRDRYIKVWSLDSAGRSSQKYSIPAIDPLSKVKWRPERRFHLAATSLMMDIAINVFDVRRPYLPLACFREHRDVTTAFAWRGDPDVIISTSRDCTLYQHVFRDAVRPSEHASPVAITTALSGNVAIADRERPPANDRNIDALEEEEGLGGRRGSEEDFLRVRSTFREMTSMPHFWDSGPIKFMAEKYILSNKLSFSDLCVHNAGVARSADRDDIAHTWSTIDILFSAMPSSEEMSKKDDGFHTPAIPPTPASVALPSESYPTPENPIGMETGAVSADGSHPEDITSEHITGNVSDLFGETLLDPLEDENGILDEEDDGDDEEGEEWTLTAEAFQPKQDLFLHGPGSPPPPTAESLLDRHPRSHLHPRRPGNQTRSPFMNHLRGNRADEESSEEDDFYHMVKISSPPSSPPDWSPLPYAKDVLESYAESGDCQTAAMLLLVLGDRIRHLIHPDVQERWVGEYLELLTRFNLYCEAAQVRRSSGIPNLTSKCLVGTQFKVNCGRCARMMQPGQTFCSRCGLGYNNKVKKVEDRKVPNNTGGDSKDGTGVDHPFPVYGPATACSLCHLPVKGLYLWCRGCAHGGHLHHMMTWFDTSVKCPAGCGHTCDFIV